MDSLPPELWSILFALLDGRTLCKLDTCSKGARAMLMAEREASPTSPWASAYLAEAKRASVVGLRVQPGRNWKQKYYSDFVQPRYLSRGVASIYDVSWSSVFSVGSKNASKPPTTILVNRRWLCAFWRDSPQAILVFDVKKCTISFKQLEFKHKILCVALAADWLLVSFSKTVIDHYVRLYHLTTLCQQDTKMPPLRMKASIFSCDGYDDGIVIGTNTHQLLFFDFSQLEKAIELGNTKPHVQQALVLSIDMSFQHVDCQVRRYGHEFVISRKYNSRMLHFDLCDFSDPSSPVARRIELRYAGIVVDAAVGSALDPDAEIPHAAVLFFDMSTQLCTVQINNSGANGAETHEAAVTQRCGAFPKSIITSMPHPRWVHSKSLFTSPGKTAKDGVIDFRVPPALPDDNEGSNYSCRADMKKYMFFFISNAEIVEVSLLGLHCSSPGIRLDPELLSKQKKPHRFKNDKGKKIDFATQGQKDRPKKNPALSAGSFRVSRNLIARALLPNLLLVVFDGKAFVLTASSDGQITCNYWFPTLDSNAVIFGSKGEDLAVSVSFCGTVVAQVQPSGTGARIWKFGPDC